MSEASLEPYCAVCGMQRNERLAHVWFYLIGPEGSKHICSQKCLFKFSGRLVLSREQLARLGIELWPSSHD